MLTPKRLTLALNVMLGLWTLAGLLAGVVEIWAVLEGRYVTFCVAFLFGITVNFMLLSGWWMRPILKWVDDEIKKYLRDM